MARWTIEIDTDNVNSVLETHSMLGKLLDIWRKNLRINHDDKPVQQVPENSEPKTES